MNFYQYLLFVRFLYLVLALPQHTKIDAYFFQMHLLCKCFFELFQLVKALCLCFLQKRNLLWFLQFHKHSFESCQTSKKHHLNLEYICRFDYCKKLHLLFVQLLCFRFFRHNFLFQFFISTYVPAVSCIFRYRLQGP